MGDSALASRDSVRLPLSDGHYIIVKKELSAGESWDLDDAPGNRTQNAVLAYLVGWSFVGDDNLPIPYHPMLPLDERRDTLRAVKESRVKEMTDALLPHLVALRRAEQEKKTIPPVEVGSV
jgi:hypothetical protein